MKFSARLGTPMGMAMLLLASAAFSAQNEQNFAQAQRQNAQKLKQYSWKSRIEIQKGGETKAVRLMLMRYDAQGKLQTTQISSTAQQQAPTRGLRGHIAKKKKEDLLEVLETLKALVQSYAELPPAEMQRLMANASLTPETGQQPRFIRTTGTNILQQGDSMTLWMDPATRHVRKVEIMTTLEKKVVRAVSHFKDLPDGPTYMARSVLTYPSEELTLTTENFDYTRVAP